MDVGNINTKEILTKYYSESIIKEIIIKNSACEKSYLREGFYENQIVKEVSLMLNIDEIKVYVAFNETAPGRAK